MIDELTLSLSDEPGAFHAVLQVLAKDEVNVLTALALGGTVAEFGVVVIVCTPIDVAMNALRRLGVRFHRRGVFAVALEDRPGRLAYVTRILADQSIDLRHLYDTVYRSPTSGLPLTILSLDALEKGVAALRQHGLEVHEELPLELASPAGGA